MEMFMNRRRFLELTSVAVPLGFFTHHASAQGTAGKKGHSSPNTTARFVGDKPFWA
jgi:hypothetical protein